MRNFLIIPILFIFLVSCSNSEDFDIPKISKLEKLEEHSNQFIKGIYSYDNGIHVAIVLDFFFLLFFYQFLCNRDQRISLSSTNNAS